MQKLKGLVSAILVGVPLAAFLLYSLHATREIAWLAAMVVGLSIFAVVATGTDSRGTASARSGHLTPRAAEVSPGAIDRATRWKARTGWRIDAASPVDSVGMG